MQFLPSKSGGCQVWSNNQGGILSLFVGSKAQGLGPCLVGVREFESRPPHAGVAKSGQTTFLAELDQKGDHRRRT